MERLKLKVSLLVGKNQGDVDLMSVYEAADALNLEVTKRQAQNLIRKAKKDYGY